jgi:Tfp pilus assembly protein PilX
VNAGPLIHGRNSGMALALCLILLLIITVVATAGMTTSTLQLRMAAGEQAATGAFQVAENAVETALQCFRPDSGDVVTSADCPAVPAAAGEQYEFVVERSMEGGSPLPEGVSLGAELESKAFTINAEATGRRGAGAAVTQGFYVLGPRE